MRRKGVRASSKRRKLHGARLWFHVIVHKVRIPFDREEVSFKKDILSKLF